MKLSTTFILLKIIRYKIHHVLFWLFYFTLWVLLYKSAIGLTKAIENAGLVIILHGSAAYFNNYYLIPLFLRLRLYVSYFVSILLTISFICFIHIVFLLWADTIDDTEKYSLWSLEFFINDGISVSYTLAITMTLMFFKQWFEKERLTDKLEKLNAETELKFLKSQINPHFLFNSLNSVYALTLTKSDMAPHVILKLSEILRYILYEGGDKVVGLKKEIDYLLNYLELEKIRYGNRLTTALEIIGDPSGLEIAPMLFLPFVENSFKHGVNATIGEAFVHIKFTVSEDKLIFNIENNKSESHEAINPDYLGGIGIENVKKRLGLLYPQKHDLQIVENISSYKVELQLELK